MQATILKKAFSRTLLTAGLAASMVACKKDKDNGPDNPGNPAGAKLAVYTNGEDYVKFDYNSDGTVKKMTVKTDDFTSGDETDFNVVYDAQKRISKLESEWQTIEVEYENNAMSRAKIFTTGQQIGYTNYHYVNGNLERATLYFGESGTFEPLLEYNMSYNAQGNLTETVTMMATGEPGQLNRAGAVTYQYDQKTNPLYEHRQLLAILWQSVSKNNITVENHVNAQNQPEDKYVYTYTYNTKGLPEKAAVKQGLPGGEQSDSEIKFSYK